MEVTGGILPLRSRTGGEEMSRDGAQQPSLSLSGDDDTQKKRVKHMARDKGGKSGSFEKKVKEEEGVISYIKHY